MSSNFKKILIKNTPAILLGIVLSSGIGWFYFSGANASVALNNMIYDILLRSNMNRLPPVHKERLAIVTIDDSSIKSLGRWPWSRKTIAQLVSNLQGLGAAVVAYDIVFSEPERNVVQEVISELPANNNVLKQSLESIIPNYDYDQLFAKTLAHGSNLLAYVFNPNNPDTTGALPEPLPVNNVIDLDDIPTMQGYLSNLDLFEKSSPAGGFINSAPDIDGVLREASLIFKYKNKLYPSIALAATMNYLHTAKVELITESDHGKTLLKGLKLDKLEIPVTKFGRILIPYRAEPYSYNYFSAADVLSNSVSKEYIEGRLIFIGASATGLGDLQSTPISAAFPGTEINASIASAMIDKYFPMKLVHGVQLQFGLIMFLGIICSFIFPFCSATILGSVFISSSILWFIIVKYLWVAHSIVITLFFPLATILALAFMNMVNSYLLTSKQKKEIKSAFGQYVPQQHIDSILQMSSDTLLNGDTRELTILFSDIKGFTTLSEQLTAVELKAQLNEYLTAMTKIIFEHDGTIDKYVGDMIMAFWNAPLPEDQHAYKAVLTGMNMQSQLKPLNDNFKEKGLPHVGIGVGINTGEVNIGDMGSTYRKAYSAIGDEVNLASRLEGMCRLYNVDVIVGEHTYAATKDKFAYLHLDKVMVKGKNKAVDIYSPIAKTEEATANIEKEIAAHHQALENYFHQRWDQAEKQFQAMQKKYPDRLLYPLFLNRVNEYKVNPPAADWDGSFVSKEK